MGAFVRGGTATEAYAAAQAAAQAAAAQAAAIAAGFAAAQSVVNVTAQRSIAVIYTNTTGKPLFVAVVFLASSSSGAAGVIYCNELTMSYQSIVGGAGSGLSCIALIPPGGTYRFGVSGATISAVNEYR